MEGLSLNHLRMDYEMMYVCHSRCNKHGWSNHITGQCQACKDVGVPFSYDLAIKSLLSKNKETEREIKHLECQYSVTHQEIMRLVDMDQRGVDYEKA